VNIEKLAKASTGFCKPGYLIVEEDFTPLFCIGKYEKSDYGEDYIYPWYLNGFSKDLMLVFNENS
jgi:hypothetical protein